MGEFFKVWAEWDYGQEDTIFTSREAAMRCVEYIAKTYTEETSPDDGFRDGQDLLDSGLASIQQLDVDTF